MQNDSCWRPAGSAAEPLLAGITSWPKQMHENPAVGTTPRRCPSVSEGASRSHPLLSFCPTRSGSLASPSCQQELWLRRAAARLFFEMFKLAVWPRAVRYLETCKTDLANVGVKLLVGGDGVTGTEQAGSVVFSRGSQKRHVWFREMPRKACRHVVCFYPLYQLGPKRCRLLA